jgi:hypothetical protein
MRYLFTLLFVLAIGMSAQGQSRSDKTGGVPAAPTAGAPLNITPGAAPPVPKKFTQLITAADKRLLAECRLFVARPDLRTPALRDSVIRALQERQNDWAPRASDGNDTAVKGERKVIEVTCNNALFNNAVGSHPEPSAAHTATTTVATTVPVQAPPTIQMTASSPAHDSPNVDHQTPQIEPWPPPRPTDQAEYSIDRTKFKTVGEFEYALMDRLNDAGIHHLRFWARRTV